MNGFWPASFVVHYWVFEMIVESKKRLNVSPTIFKNHHFMTQLNIYSMEDFSVRMYLSNGVEDHPISVKGLSLCLSF